MKIYSLLLIVSYATVAAIAAKADTSSDRDQVPEPIFRTQAYYPPELKSKGIGGSATVEFLIDDQGEVVETHVVDASNEEFGWAAVASISKWKFKPGKKHGHAVYVRMRMPYTFTAPKDTDPAAGPTK